MSWNTFYKTSIYLCIYKGYLLPNYHMLCIILDGGNMVLGENLHIYVAFILVWDK